MSAAERRNSILNTAMTLVAKYGYWGATIREIAEAEGITEAGVLYYFGNKEKLLISVIDHHDMITRRAIAVKLGLPPDEVGNGIANVFPVGLRELTIANVQVNESRSEFVRLYSVLQAEALAPEHPAYEFFLDREHRVLSEYADGARRDGVENPESTAIEVLGAMDGLQLRWLHNLDGIDFVDEWMHIINRLIPEHDGK
ncbi:TetR/AcrR family transcriptional regulator [Bifidobacterium sp. 82T24]|nr:TetR/AcrR family transcriptional regulator [Bifidobacterium pluvialisilvae]